ncbi:MAG: histidinol-phosphatase HisJ family protein [Candidatus Omnitrophica bacterium]|nr:histidinol-phosphatase HisJ family protein [Candidatus Omnitrophota bacterium]
MKPLADYHVHTGFCPHAVGQIREYITAALEKGLREVGFCDHLPLVGTAEKDYTMSRDDLSRYVDEVMAARSEYRSEIVVTLGIEADFFPGFEEKTRELIHQYPFDFICGSIHFIDGWAFDKNEAKSDWQALDVEDIYARYIALLGDAAKTGFFDFLGHVDLVKKFGYRPQRFLAEEWRRLALILKQTGVAIEINSSGLRKEAQEIYPSPAVLQIFHAHDVSIVFGSDAHAPDEVGMDFEACRQLALAAGYREAILFQKRQAVKTYCLS